MWLVLMSIRLLLMLLLFVMLRGLRMCCVVIF